MSIDEAQLDTWSRVGSVKQSRDTYASIKNILESAGPLYAQRVFQTFLQGSYGNDTNVYKDSDVDVVIQLDSVFYRDLSRLPQPQKVAYEQAFSSATYKHSEFKKEVIAWLSAKYDRVIPGKKAVFVPGSGNRRDADVLVATQFRRYYEFVNMSNQRYDQGICFFLADGTMIENFPKQHSANCTTKHQNTKQRFKPTVRFFKNMRNHMVDNGLLSEGIAPSYFIEGLLYNVPDANFGASYQETFINCFNWIVACDQSKLVCANRLHRLVRDDAHPSWPIQDCATFLTSAKDLWEHW
jgi:hypothetical protein